ncbi:hypothetical protein [Lysinibacillus sp. 54212]|uniref:hypothetical protein n=1 Tax=Lysinibacillus sp. 54212 TaxID=3119829 RepID=UPI002FCB65FB
MEEHLELDMLVSDFVEVVKQQQLSNESIRKILVDLGETLSKNSISNIYTVSGYEVLDSRKKIIEPTESANDKMTLREAVQLARSLRMQHEKTAVKKPKEKVQKEIKPVVIDTRRTDQEQLPNEFAGRIPSNPFEIDRAAEATEFILAALDLTQNELESIKNLIYSNNESSSNLIESNSIYEAIKQLGGRDRKNKTYYISEEIINLVAEFAEGKSVKVSQFVEIAMLDAIKKYQ